MAYRPSSHLPETAWARHLDNIRRERDWSATQLFEHVRVPLGLAEKSRSAFASSLHRDPRPAYVPVLRQLFGDPPAEPEATKEPEGSDPTGLLEAMTRALLAQAQAFTALETAVAQRFEDASAERAVMLDSLARLEAELHALRAPATNGAGTSSQHRSPA